MQQLLATDTIHRTTTYRSICVRSLHCHHLCAHWLVLFQRSAVRVLEEDWVLLVANYVDLHCGLVGGETRCRQTLVLRRYGELQT